MKTHENPSGRKEFLRRIASSGFVTILALLVLLSASERLPMTWDEGESIDRVEKLRAWFHCENPMTSEAIKSHWIFTRQIEGHPAGYAFVIALGRTISERFSLCPGEDACEKSFLSHKTSYRLGPIALFALALGAVFYRVSRKFGYGIGFLAPVTILLFPRVFAHAQIAACDSSLTACWLLAWAFFPHAFGRTFRTTFGKTSAVAFWGTLLGMTLSMKFTAWISLLPFFVSLFFFPFSRVLSLRRFAWFVFALTVAMLVFYGLNPPLWFSPFVGFYEFVTLNTHRSEFNIAILFLGKMYNLDHPLPWYNTILWTLFTVPLGFLILLALAALRFCGVTKKETATLASDRRFLLLLLVHPVTILVVRALPGTPPHDGVRLFVTAFPFLAIAAAFGAQQLLRSRIGRVFTSLVYAFALLNMFWYCPQWLSYYNALIGGLPGAARAGMEPTYYWDSLDREVFTWLEENVNENETVLFCPASAPKTLALQKRWGELRVDYLARGEKLRPDRKLRYYILQRRPSGEYPPDRRLIRESRPVYVKYVRHGGYGPWKFDETPLLEIYEFKDYLRAFQREKLIHMQNNQSRARKEVVLLRN